MGRVKTQLAKRTTYQLMDSHGKEFTKNFEDNKKIVKTVMKTPSKKLRNIITGYITRLVSKGHTSAPKKNFSQNE